MATKGTKDFDNAIKRIPEIEAKTRRYDKILQEHNMTQAQADKVLGQAGLKIDNNGDVLNRAGVVQRDYNKSIRDNVGALGQFNMEQLGVMFGGMALDRAMTNLNATSREWLGMGELTSTMMGVTMLDANMALLEFGILPLFDALTSLPPAAQKAIGFMSIALEGLGMAMMTGGQLMLGLDSTSTMLAKIAGISPNIVFTSKGFAAIKSKFAKTTKALKTIGKLAVIGVTLSEVASDIKEGEITAAIGTALAGYGVLRGNKWAISVGLALKFVGDEEFERKVARLLISLGDKIHSFAEWATGTIKKIFTGDWGDIDAKFFNNFGKIYREEAEKMNAEGRLSSDMMIKGFAGMSSNAEGYAEKLDEITNKYVDGGAAWTNAMDNLNNEYSVYLDFLEEGNARLRTQIDLIDRLNSGSSLIDEMNRRFAGTNVGGESYRLGQTLGSKAVGGNINKTGPYYLHKGERVMSKSDVSDGVAVNVTYNVNVSDKREFEQMLKKNNDSLTAQVRRMVKI